MIIVSAIVFALLLGTFIFAMVPQGRGWQRLASAAMFIVLIAIVYGGAIESLSRPKPQALEWRSPAKAKVLGASMDEGKAIYVWLQIGQAAEPRAYALPWSVQTAQQLQAAMRQARVQGTAVEVENPFGSAGSAKAKGAGNAAANSDQAREPRFYAQPQQPMPPKTRDEDTAYLPPQSTRR